MNKPSTESLEEAAQLWCLPETQHIVMIPELVEAFAHVIDKYKVKPSLDIQQVNYD